MASQAAAADPMETLLNRAGQLHSAPTVALKIVEITRSPAFEIGDVVDCLQRDPALAGSILRLVNSARFGLLYKVAGIRQAVSYLGSRVLRLTALSFGLVRHLTRNQPGRLYEFYWKRSLTMACAARLCAKRIGEDQDEAFTAGLLSDLGMLVLAQFHGNHYADMAVAVDDSEQLVSAEQEQFGFDHATVTARLLQKWDLPSAIVEATGEHHQHSHSAAPLTRLLRVASLLTDALWSPQSARMQVLTELLADEFDCDMDDLIDLALACRSDVREAEDIFGVRLSSDIDIDMVQSEARRQLETATLDAMLELDVFDAMAADYSLESPSRNQEA